MKKDLPSQIIELLLDSKLPSEDQAVQLVERCAEILQEEENLLYLHSPISIVGDIHGQFYDLLELFDTGGYPPFTNYLFLGDYVDRGKYSVETILFLLSHYFKYPSHVTLLRGNHEARKVNKFYGFFQECSEKYGENSRFFESITNLFDLLPIAAIVEAPSGNSVTRALCIHGGIGKWPENVEQIKMIDRKVNPSESEELTDLLWSDPGDNNLNGLKVNKRGAGHLFGKDVVYKFLKENNLNMIIRGHQYMPNGMEIKFDGKVITVWSAPNYCGKHTNIGTILEFYDIENNDSSFVFNSFNVRNVD